MSTKKKIFISITLVIVATLVAGLVGFLRGGNNETLLELNDPHTITYYTSEAKTEGFSLQLSNDFASKIFISIDESVDGLQCYSFKHLDSGEVLFMIYISEGKLYENITEKYDVIGKTDNYTYVWTQSVDDNTHILDETRREDFNNIAKYYATIKSTVKIIDDTKE